MVQYCIVPGCKNAFIPGISFHRLPANEKLKKLWIHQINRHEAKNCTVSGSSRVCSAHFLASDYKISTYRHKKCLNVYAIPSVFPFILANLSRKILHKIPVEKETSQNVIMGRIFCIVPGCLSYYSTNRKHSASEREKNISLFLLPRNPDLFEKWRTAIPAYDFDLKKTDHVCELHFREDEIERFYITKLNDGTISKIEKGRVTLKAGSVPSIFPDSSENEMRRRKLHIVETPEDNLSLLKNLKKDVRQGNFSYETLLRTVAFLKKPNNLWSFTATSNFIIFARWNNNYMPEKRVVIERNLNAKVFLKENEIRGTDLLEITNDDDIISLLQKVENYKFYS